MARFKLTIEYDGSRYSGWQKQKDTKSIQGEFYKACSTVFNTNELEVYGSGRTDTGVHALGQVAHLEVKTNMKPREIRIKLNDALPSDIAITDIEPVEKNFHARHSAVARSYIYHISKRRTAFGKKYVWWIKDELNVDAMRDAAQNFLGMRDFASFSVETPEETSTKVEILMVNLHEENDSVIVHIVGSHFLWKMVRRIVGVLVEVGRGNMTSKDVQSFMRKFSNTPAKFTAPPSGLFLEHIYYPGEDINSDFKTLINI